MAIMATIKGIVADAVRSGHYKRGRAFVRGAISLQAV
jgi:hypothetical protein